MDLIGTLEWITFFSNINHFLLFSSLCQHPIHSLFSVCNGMCTQDAFWKYFTTEFCILWGCSYWHIHLFASYKTILCSIFHYFSFWLLCNVCPLILVRLHSMLQFSGERRRNLSLHSSLSNLANNLLWIRTTVSIIEGTISGWNLSVTQMKKKYEYSVETTSCEK